MAIKLGAYNNHISGHTLRLKIQKDLDKTISRSLIVDLFWDVSSSVITNVYLHIKVNLL